MCQTARNVTWNVGADSCDNRCRFSELISERFTAPMSQACDACKHLAFTLRRSSDAHCWPTSQDFGRLADYFCASPEDPPERALCRVQARLLKAFVVWAGVVEAPSDQDSLHVKPLCKHGHGRDCSVHMHWGAGQELWFACRVLLALRSMSSNEAVKLAYSWSF